MEDMIKEILTQALAELKVASANATTHPYRWSATDLATDLAPLVTQRLTDRIPKVTFEYEPLEPGQPYNTDEDLRKHDPFDPH